MLFGRDQSGKNRAFTNGSAVQLTENAWNGETFQDISTVLSGAGISDPATFTVDNVGVRVWLPADSVPAEWVVNVDEVKPGWQIIMERLEELFPVTRLRVPDLNDYPPALANQPLKLDNASGHSMDGMSLVLEGFRENGEPYEYMQFTDLDGDGIVYEGPGDPVLIDANGDELGNTEVLLIEGLNIGPGEEFEFSVDLAGGDFPDLEEFQIVAEGDIFLRADLNGDLIVDVEDLGTLAGNWRQSSGATREDGDITGDGAVDVEDLGILAGEWRLEDEPSGATVPEPLSVTLLAAGVLPVLRRRRKAS